MKVIQFGQCSACGGSNETGSRYCASCGEKLDKNDVSAALESSVRQSVGADGLAIAVTDSPALATVAGSFLASGNLTTEASSERSVAYASFWRRMAALLIDLVIVYAASWPLSLVLLRLPGKPVVALWFFASCYFWIGNAFGATLGKKILSIRVVDEDGKRPGLVRSFKRCILPMWLGIVYALFYPNVTVLVLLVLLVQLFDYFSYFRDEERQTPHDRMGGTWVVRS